jgi:predicted RNA-binding Zn ribbon-like protein
VIKNSRRTASPQIEAAFEGPDDALAAVFVASPEIRAIAGFLPSTGIVKHRLYWCSMNGDQFRFGLGHVVLEFVATLARRRDEQPVERLEKPADLSCWLERAGLGAGIRVDPEVIAEARALREAIFRLLDAVRGQTRPAAADLRIVNGWARQPTPAPQLDRSIQLRWVAADPARGALARIAAATIELLAGPDLERIRSCADPTCSLMFIDRSRPGRRRWCSMDRCGNRAKTARYRHRDVTPTQRGRHR